jgi:hypothetical protein
MNLTDKSKGYIAGIIEAYAGKPFLFKEIDCRAIGDRVCRFDVHSPAPADALFIDPLACGELSDIKLRLWLEGGES